MFFFSHSEGFLQILRWRKWKHWPKSVDVWKFPSQIITAENCAGSGVSFTKGLWRSVRICAIRLGKRNRKLQSQCNIALNIFFFTCWCYLPIFDVCRSMPAHQPGDPIGQSHVVSLLKNIKSSADLSDPFLREIALAAATRHRKKGNLLLILLLLIAVWMKFTCNWLIDWV